MNEVEHYNKAKLTKIVDMKPRLQCDLVKLLKERFVIMTDVMGDKLETPVKVTESQIQGMQDLYIRNLVRICVMFIKTIKNKSRRN